ncbi:MAG: diguanylate cyclase [Spirochaetales bacterium]|nr:diguanylate cyclase [Spirochaetales bacterium]
MDDRDRTYEYIVNTSSDFITLINKKYEYEVVNDSYCRVLGKKREEILGHHVARIWGNSRFEDKIRLHLDKCFSGRDIHYIEEFDFGPEHKYMHVSYYPYRIGGEITHALVFSHDISRMGQMESQLHNFEFRDSVTGLFNRKSLDIILDMEIEKARRSRGEPDRLRAVIFISIANLQEINLAHGYDRGNMLLENSGIRIKEFLRQSDYVFRYDGQELVVLLSNLAGESDSAKVAQKLFEKITMPYRSDRFDITLHCHMGISLYPRDSADGHELIQSAAKALGESIATSVPFCIYDGELHNRALDKLHMESDLYRAFEHNQFELYYQPITTPEGRIKGCETLIRWNHPEKGFIRPDQFIPVAEANGLITAIGKWIIYRTVEKIRKWSVPYGIYISINLSVREFENEDLFDILVHAMGKGGELPR